jgi:hypothetical protein
MHAEKKSIDIQQQKICEKYGSIFVAASIELKLGVGRDFDRFEFPLNGLRHPPQGGTTGWYIWSGEEMSREADYFQPLHAGHLVHLCPEILKFLALAPGWRFLLAPNYEDVWYDKSLLNI